MKKFIKSFFELLDITSKDTYYPGSFDGTWIKKCSERCCSETIASTSPITNSIIGLISSTSNNDYIKIISNSKKAFSDWRLVPAPKRGEIVRQYGDELRKYKTKIAKLITIEMGKPIQESLGEVQEVIDICDYACGQSRMLYGVQTHSERPGHRLYEQWHPLGVVAIISSFNFPVAVWGWNMAIALICGNTCIWKPSKKTALCAIVCQRLLEMVLKRNNMYPAVSTLMMGNGCGAALTTDRDIALVSFTGSTHAGRAVSTRVAGHFGKCILELGGNNAVIVTKNADIDLAVENVFFGAIGTNGQRCTSTRRVIIHEKIYSKFKKKLLNKYKTLTIGNPLHEDIAMGPLIDKEAVENILNDVKLVEKQKGKVILKGHAFGFNFLSPFVIEVKPSIGMLREESFGPLLYLIKYNGDVIKAIEIQNLVPQGLSSSIFTKDIHESEIFLSAIGSDCGIANVNCGTSGAEIGLAFGGEKETGGGRESGSDAWKNYMRRQSCVINWSGKTKLAQGIKLNK